MNALSPVAARQQCDRLRAVADDIGAGRYMTDGINLYRQLGGVSPYGARGMTVVEDCRSLEMVLMPLAALPRLRPVAAAGDLA